MDTLLNEVVIDHIKKTLRFILGGDIIILVGLGILAIIIITIISNKISKPIVKLRNEALKLGSGNFDVKIEEKGSLEVRNLAQTFNRLGTKLTQYVENLKKEISIRESVENEIRIAGEIQQSILPKLTADFNNEQFSLATALLPAKDVAGDFYDFFFLDENRIALIIADVSGKGISSAIFMAMAKTLIRDLIFIYPNDPSQVLIQANSNLFMDNSSCMFITLFIVYYDIPSGKFLYANAGHHSAISLTSSGEYKEFGVMGNTVLGMFPDQVYHVGEASLSPEETLILYTDGIIDAISPNNDMYGNEHLKQILVDSASLSPDALIDKVVSDVKSFEDDSRFDDITILALRRKK